ncbi:transcriptional regulator [Streptomyces endophyticus]|uniref:Transcriptional regulator n=1 Tax=Streptomyces endophyticus TaxID=714166 RepID=A0ABU6EZX6_9ACTN|nr:transcriptional regulator [Streptomyces endophyticus]MEB8337282.1 transcriptional regulator [Streptomyces endophyticus]
MEPTPPATDGHPAPDTLTSNSVRRDAYADSVALMRAAQHLTGLPGITAASLVMATDPNLRLLADAQLLTDEGRAARPADLIVALRGTADAIEHALGEVPALLEQPAASESAEPEAWVPRALGEVDPATALALISTPGPYAAAEALKALRRGMHAFVFSDNVPVEQEIRIKEEAHRRGLLAMGPDCGTGVLDGVPLGFANVLRPGRIGLIGASGTGLQQVSCLLDAAGEGVRQMIGTGGRDLSAEVGARTTLDALDLLAVDPGCELIVLVSKPPAPEVAERVIDRAGRAGKPVVAAFLGTARPAALGDLAGAERPGAPGPVTVVGTLRDAARAVVRTLGGVPAPAWAPPAGDAVDAVPGRYLRALYAGGTFAYEARQLLPGAVTEVDPYVPGRDITLPERHLVLDLGDDAYTAGRPHPMIDPTVRAAHLRAALTDPHTAAVVLDVVLGHGAGADPAGALATELERVGERGRPPVIAFVVGTDGDPQDADAVRARLEKAGALLAPTSTDAAEWAVSLVGADAEPRRDAGELMPSGRAGR